MNGWGPSDEGFATREATINDAVDWARLQLEIQKKTPSAEFCEDDMCGEPIPQMRRELVPGVKYCVHCQSKYDNITLSTYNRRGSKDSQLR